jgi:hypothetical protein
MILALVMATGLTLVGCGGKKQDECKALVEAINPHVTALGKLSDGLTADTSPEASAKALQSMVGEVEAGAAAVKKLNLETPELKKFGEDYQKMCTDSAKAFGDMIAVGKKVDAAQKAGATNPEAALADLAAAVSEATNAETAIKKATAPESAIVEGLNKFCGAE